MWDIYRTQLPLITALFPQRAVELATALLSIAPRRKATCRSAIGWPGRGPFSRQAARCHTFLADLCQLGVRGIDWDWALCHLDTDLETPTAKSS
jgi:putative alpha-1,2-mannosidase